MPDATPTTTPIDEIGPTVDRLRAAHAGGATRPLSWRLDTITRLREAVVARTEDIVDALRADMGKPRAEVMLSETNVVLAEADHALAHLPDWVRPQKVPTPASTQPGSSRIEFQPLGVACVISPWNYPINLSLAPVVDAIAAGNAVVLKPSELAPSASDVLAAIIDDVGDPALAVVQGGVAETTELLAQRFDHICFTGGGKVARIVMRAAAEHLTPVTLELGGKSPAIVSRSAKIDQAARRIVWGKFTNAGQTCIAPDHVLVERSVHDEFVRAVERSILDFYGADPRSSGDFARIVNDAHFHRVEKLIDSGTVVVGGQVDVDELYIAPTVLTDVDRSAPIMQEEIFGPVLPVLAVDSMAEAVAVVNEGDHPLALYVFSEDEDEVDAVLDTTTSGGVTVNGTIFHIANPELPFGGVGESGMGAYHGRFGFETFSHRRAVHERSTRIDPSLAYPPYTEKNLKMIQRALALGDPRDRLARVKQALLRRR